MSEAFSSSAVAAPKTVGRVPPEPADWRALRVVGSKGGETRPLNDTTRVWIWLPPPWLNIELATGTGSSPAAELLPAIRMTKFFCSPVTAPGRAGKTTLLKWLWATESAVPNRRRRPSRMPPPAVLGWLFGAAVRSTFKPGFRPTGLPEASRGISSLRALFKDVRLLGAVHAGTGTTTPGTAALFVISPKVPDE